ncbi:hypothetical protein IEQ34_003394 [Dendrobium chrysotoxum]|uniref:Protein kinase domain-containing protein n=1 Tax=Dendrobium chrysotoxum TaxID=161865 RepID=A0AAV7HH61_DENCH|nr:hypothetical protein IEQ34_003394 [Dendrobium chrysotoxum]
MAERQSCKLKVRSSILREGIFFTSLPSLLPQELGVALTVEDRWPEMEEGQSKLYFNRKLFQEASVVEGNGPVTGHIISTTIDGKNGEAKQTVSYMAERVVGTGSFGIAKCLETGETVAIKKVLQDRRYKNRELQLMRSMDHPNLISLKHCFFSTTNRV